MIKFSSVKLWLTRLQREIEESPLGAIGLFIGLFGIFLGLLTSWAQLVSWLSTNWFKVIFAIVLAIFIMTIFRCFAHKIRQKPLEEQAQKALEYLTAVLDNGRAIQRDKAVKILVGQGMKNDSANEALDMLTKSKKLKQIEDGTITLMDIEDENK